MQDKDFYQRPYADGVVFIDIEGTTLTPEEASRIQNPLVGGIILFARNYTSRNQLIALIDSIHALRKDRILITVDHEGGRVQRFKTDGFTHLPPMRILGQRFEQDPLLALADANALGYVLATELRACGVDFSFTPVLDIDYQRSEVIGNRALSSQALAIVQIARALIQGLTLGGMSACGKHFPGHGYVQADSHHSLPIDARSLDEILENDAHIYLSLGSLILPSVMPAHIVYSEVDHLPAGFSKRWLQDILRQQLEYRGLIFSDDLSMAGAALVHPNIVDRAYAALEAGCDKILLCNAPDQAEILLNALSWSPNQKSLHRFYRLYPKYSALSGQALQQDPIYQEALSRVHHLQSLYATSY